MRWRWPHGVPEKVHAQIEHELALIEELKYESYFLTVQDIVRFARSQHILCQGRGSAANSAVCFALGVTEVDPARMNLLVERFISKERNEPPDIDVDFEHERREEVIQYIYAKYGRERAALAATVICYRGKSAVRDVAKALGLPLDQVDQLSGIFARWEGETPLDELLREQGFDPDSPVMRRVHEAHRRTAGHAAAPVPARGRLRDQRRAAERAGAGGKRGDARSHHHPVGQGRPGHDEAAQGRLPGAGHAELRAQVPGSAARASRPGLHHGDRCRRKIRRPIAMIQRADTVGVFQIESRAQMAMLPRHRPENFYDLVIQVAIVRPGPIQGDMVHPYLRRPAWRGAGGLSVGGSESGVRTHAGRAAVPGAGDETGDRGGRLYAPARPISCAARWRRGNGTAAWSTIASASCAACSSAATPTEFAARLFEQIKGFGSYGFPESHAASFAGIVYASCWLKCHEPAAFACALLNAQPMGFYAPSQIVQDAAAPRHRGARGGRAPQRLGLHAGRRRARSRAAGDPAGPAAGARVSAGCRRAAVGGARAQRDFADVVDLCSRTGIDRRQQELLAEAGALQALAGHRHRAKWAVAGVEAQLPLFGRVSPPEQAVSLPPPIGRATTWWPTTRVPD